MITKTQQYLLLKLPPRILGMINVDSRTGCWLWEGELNGTGYGRIWMYGIRHTLHRLVWKLLRDDLGSDLVLDHHCKNRHCCNPAHLSPVTQKQNIHRGNARLFK